MYTVANIEPIEPEKLESLRRLLGAAVANASDLPARIRARRADRTVANRPAEPSSSGQKHDDRPMLN